MPPTRALAALLLLAPACAEDSSFVLRWQVGRTSEDAEVPLTSVRQCSDLGLSRVRVLTLAADGTQEDLREFPCFPEAFTDPAGVAPGPELGPGTYYVSILGLTRRGIARPDPSDAEEVLARDDQKVVVDSRGEGVVVDGFRLIGIDECHDGIDNDRDGAIDLSDTPCRQGQIAEDLDVSGALFTFVATLLGDNPRATCAGLGLDRIRITLDGDVANAREIACTTVSQSFSADLGPGEHTWTVEGLAVDGSAVTEALPGAPFTVFAKDFVLVEIAVDFSLDVFLADPAFAKSQRFALEYMPYEDAPLARACVPVTGALELGDVKITLLAATADAPDDFAVVESATLPALDDAPFPVTAACDEFQKVLGTSPLEWSADGNASYRMVVEAWSPGDMTAPCFSNAGDPAILAPGIDLSLSVPRVRSDGACSDCPNGDECPNCVDGVCML